MPVNIHLKTPSERQSIIQFFAAYLKVAPDNLQIRVSAERLDIEGYTTKMWEYHTAEENELCREMIEDNIAEFSYIAANEVVTHRFFIAFEYEPQMRAKSNNPRAIAARLNEAADTARRYLDLCGLEVLEPDYADNVVLEMLYKTINKQTGRRVRLPDGVFDMISAVHGEFDTN